MCVDHQPVFGENDHDPRALDTVDLLQGASQFSLKGSDIIGLLDEVRHAEGRSVKNFETRSIGLGHALGSELSPQGMNLFGGHLNRRSTRDNAVRNLLGFQDTDNATHFGGIQSTVQQAPIGPATEQRYGDTGNHDAETGETEQHLLGDAQFGEDLSQLLG